MGLGGYRKRAIALVACAAFSLGVANAQEDDSRRSWKDRLKDALEEYVEEKAEDAGLEDQDSNRPSSVSLKFAGATVPEPDIFQPIRASSPSTPSGGQTAAEQACFSAIQGKIAWDAAGNNKTWGPANIKNLCKGTTQPLEPGKCFRYAMFNGSAWGKKSSHAMTWSKASRLCAGTNNAQSTTTCFKNAIASGQTLDNAINQCDGDPATGTAPIRYVYNPKVVLNTKLLPQPAPPKGPSGGKPSTSGGKEAECFDYVQGNIAWDPQGRSKTWGANNLRRLCKGTTSKFSPGNCFKYVMFSGASWGKKPQHSVTWREAVDLCEGTSSAQATTSCFKNAIARGRSLQQAIAQCDK